jgi:hypothetical protein
MKVIIDPRPYANREVIDVIDPYADFDGPFPVADDQPAFVFCGEPPF